MVCDEWRQVLCIDTQTKSIDTSLYGLINKITGEFKIVNETLPGKSFKKQIVYFEEE